MQICDPGGTGFKENVPSLDRETSLRVQGASPSLPSGESMVRLDRDYRHMSDLIAKGTGEYRGLGAAETKTLIDLLEELLAAAGSSPICDAPGSAHELLMRDFRAVAIFKARDDRRRLSLAGPIRYMGFVDNGKFRVFNFGRLPQGDDGDQCRIRVSWSFFSGGHIALQEGPGFCAALLAEQTRSVDYQVTSEDVTRYAASRPVHQKVRKNFRAAAVGVKVGQS